MIASMHIEPCSNPIADGRFIAFTLSVDVGTDGRVLTTLCLTDGASAPNLYRNWFFEVRVEAHNAALDLHKPRKLYNITGDIFFSSDKLKIGSRKRKFKKKLYY